MAQSSSGLSIKPSVLIAEFVGTFALTFAVLASINGVLATEVPTAVLAGVVLGISVIAVGKISGSHINPAVTWGLMTSGKVSFNNAVGYWAAQVAGALSAFGIMNLVLENDVLQVTSATSDWRIFFAELIGAAIFVYGVSAAVHQKLDGAAAGLVVGGSLFLGIFFATVASNGVVNPAVALGIGSATGAYVLGPLVGASLGAWVHSWMVDHN